MCLHDADRGGGVSITYDVICERPLSGGSMECSLFFKILKLENCFLHAFVTFFYKSTGHVQFPVFPGRDLFSWSSTNSRPCSFDQKLRY